jgi:glycosyltransferase involved in cell wall biosynthesis
MDFCLSRVAPTVFASLLNMIWVYLTVIRGSYELTAVEAQAAGAVIVTVDNTTHPEIYEAGVSGYGVINDSGHISARLLALIKGIILQGPSGPLRTRSFVVERFAWHRIALALGKKVTSLIKEA